MIPLYILIFIISCLVLFWSGSRLVNGLMKMANYLGWREFIVAFFVMAIAGSAPNLFVGINSALRGIPQLSFGEIVGGNVLDLTLAVALAVLIGGASLPAKSKMVQTSAIFTAAVAVLPLILILDGFLGRGDGLVLISTFIFYVFWLFSKEERFKKVYNESQKDPKTITIRYLWEFLRKKRELKAIRRFKTFFRNLGGVMIALFFLLLASEGIVRSAQVFSNALGLSISVVGILIIGIGNALPETYFAIISARKKRNWMILGNLMGSVIICATLVLGIVALIHPIEIIDFSPFAIARIFLIISALFFLVVVRTGKKITKIEALFLLAIYIAFLLIEIFFH